MGQGKDNYIQATSAIHRILLQNLALDTIGQGKDSCKSDNLIKARD
jgi:hypothetical protein